MKFQSILTLLALTLTAAAMPGGGQGNQGGQGSNQSGGQSNQGGQQGGGQGETCQQAYNNCQSQGRALCFPDNSGNCECVSSSWISQHGNEQLSRACPQGPHYVEINIIPEIFVNQCNAGSQYGGGLKFPLSSCQSYEG